MTWGERRTRWKMIRTAKRRELEGRKVRIGQERVWKESGGE